MSTTPTALVTGAAQGIGAAIARTLEEGGFRVLTVDINDTARGGEHMVTDLQDPNAPAAVGAWAGSRSDRVDLLVNNAAMSRKMPLEDVTTAMFDQMVAINMRAPLFLIQQLRPLLAGGGSIVTVSSIRASLGFAADVAYQMTKGGLESMTRALAVELAAQSIRVNAVAPGAIRTPMNEAVQADPVALAAATSRIPLGRFGRPDEVAKAVLYLARARFVTGQVLTIDGGQTVFGTHP